jgi:hypothetical protein
MTHTIVEVTQKHIDAAIRASTTQEKYSVGGWCIITQALKDAFASQNVETYLADASVDDKGYNLSGEAQKITAMDSLDWGSVKPFSFTVTPMRKGEDF